MSYEYKDAAKNALYTVYALTRISSEQIEQAYGELDHVYEQADKADEYEAKAKAFDRIVEERNKIGKLMHNKEYPRFFTDEAFWNIDDIINDTESGELDE